MRWRRCARSDLRFGRASSHLPVLRLNVGLGDAAGSAGDGTAAAVAVCVKVFGDRRLGQGNAAIALWRSHGPDAVVLDMMLPKRSGFLVLEELLEADSPPIVVMVTANEGRRHETYARRLGVREYLVKPVPLTVLLDALVTHLDGPSPA